MKGGTDEEQICFLLAGPGCLFRSEACAARTFRDGLREAHALSAPGDPGRGTLLVISQGDSGITVFP